MPTILNDKPESNNDHDSTVPKKQIDQIEQPEQTHPIKEITTVEPESTLSPLTVLSNSITKRIQSASKNNDPTDNENHYKILDAEFGYSDFTIQRNEVSDNHGPFGYPDIHCKFNTQSPLNESKWETHLIPSEKPHTHDLNWDKSTGILRNHSIKHQKKTVIEKQVSFLEGSVKVLKTYSSEEYGDRGVILNTELNELEKQEMRFFCNDMKEKNDIRQKFNDLNLFEYDEMNQHTLKSILETIDSSDD